MLVHDMLYLIVSSIKYLSMYYLIVIKVYNTKNFLVSHYFLIQNVSLDINIIILTSILILKSCLTRSFR